MTQDPKSVSGSTARKLTSAPKPTSAALPPGPIRNRWALLVGVNDFVDPAIPSLRYCVNDVLAMQDLLHNRGYTTIALHDDVTQPHLLPTRDNVEAELARLCHAAQPDDLLWVHLACHGQLVRGEPLLITRETREPTLARKALPLSQVEKQLRASKARRLVLTLDACHTGVEIGRALADPQFMKNVYHLAEGFVLFAASTAQQVAQEWQDAAHGVFTYFLLDGLSGGADRSGKGFVTVDDLKLHVLDGLRRWSVQHAGLIQEPTARTEGLGDIILAELPAAQPQAHAPPPVQRLPFEPELVTVPAGPFLMGTSEAQIADMIKPLSWMKRRSKKDSFSREMPQREVHLPAFQIGRYPVTNAQYHAFVTATFRAAPEYWGGLRLELSNYQAVVAVSWSDARAYAAWLRQQTGKPYRLPTEAEWEKAARGDDGRLWPWGDDWDPARCMNSERRIPWIAKWLVGAYSPAGDSPYGCADMAGNVYEWCHSLYRDYPYSDDDGREDPEAGGPRVVRGGSFYSDRWDTRCAYRSSGNPGLGRDWIGFRVVVGPDLRSGTLLPRGLGAIRLTVPPSPHAQ